MIISSIFYWTGALTWGFVVAWLVVAFARGLAIAIDWMWWSLACIRAHGGNTKWRWVPWVFLRRWWYFTWEPTGTTWRSHRGTWNGFRDWVVWPPVGGEKT